MLRYNVRQQQLTVHWVRPLSVSLAGHTAIAALLLWAVHMRPLPEPSAPAAVTMEFEAPRSEQPAAPAAPAPPEPPAPAVSPPAPEPAPVQTPPPPEPPEPPPAPSLTEDPPSPPPTPTAPAPLPPQEAVLPAPPAAQPPPEPPRSAAPRPEHPPEPHRTPRARPHPAAPAPEPAQASAAPSAAAPTAAAPTTADPGPTWRSALSAWLLAHRTYPDEARRRGEEGTVLVRFTVARDGEVTTVTVVRGSGSEVLDHAAEAILRNARLPAFTAEMTGSEVTVSVPIHYRLER